MPLEFLGAQEEYVEFVIREVLPEAARLADAAYVFLERGSFEVSEARRYLEACDRHGLAPRLHADHRHHRLALPRLQPRWGSRRGEDKVRSAAIN